MPDHFHGLIEIPKGEKSLGDAICAFKSRVVHEYIKRVKAGEWPRFPGKIWQRNYYERIVWTREAEEKISRYIRMNPWRCITEFGNGLRGMGNPTLWNKPKIGVLASQPRAGGNVGGREVRKSKRGGPEEWGGHKARPYLGGFHSPTEKGILADLLKRKADIIWCPAWGLGGNLSPDAIDALENNRMLILEMNNRAGDRFAAEDRNRFILENSDELWLPYIAPGGMLDRLLRQYGIDPSAAKSSMRSRMA